jgi:hypothetical protein
MPLTILHVLTVLLLDSDDLICIAAGYSTASAFLPDYTLKGKRTAIVDCSNTDIA